jgi:hypothetical protein
VPLELPLENPPSVSKPPLLPLLLLPPLLPPLPLLPLEPLPPLLLLLVSNPLPAVVLPHAGRDARPQITNAPTSVVTNKE